MWRVFMCTAGTSGERICATSEMPLAQKRGSSPAPGIWARNSGENSPETVEMLTPDLLEDVALHHRHDAAAAFRALPLPCARTGPARGRPAVPRRYASSIASKAAQMRSRSAANQVVGAGLALADGGVVGHEGSPGRSAVCRNASPEHHRGGERDIERAAAGLHRERRVAPPRPDARLRERPTSRGRAGGCRTAAKAKR